MTFLFLLVPYLTITVLFTFAQRRLLYHPVTTEALLVSDAGFAADQARDLTVTTEDGLALHGWWLAGQSQQPSVVAGAEDEGQSKELPLVIYFPGNASNRAGRRNDLRDFTRLGCDVLIVDYRGYAENPGSPTQPTMEADAVAVWDFATSKLQRDPSEIILFGESLGGAVAISLASKLCKKEMPPAALITNATFASVPRLAAPLYPLFPFRWFVLDDWPSIDRIANVTCPILMFHGTVDTLIPLAEGRALFDVAPPTSAGGIEKTFVEIPGAGHNDIPVSRLRQSVSRLLATRGIPAN